MPRAAEMDAGLARAGEAQAALLATRRPVYARLHEFNLLPSVTLHPTWAASLFPAGLAPIAEKGGDARVHRWLSAYLLKSLRLGGLAHWVPNAPLAIAALAPGALLALSGRVGAALLAPRLRAALAGGQAGTVRSTIDAPLLDYALSRAPLLAGSGEIEVPPVEPEAIGGAMRPLGVAALRAACEAQDLWARARLKLPRELVQAAEDLQPREPAAWARLALRVARESEPKWHTSFAPVTA